MVPEIKTNLIVSEIGKGENLKTLKDLQLEEANGPAFFAGTPSSTCSPFALSPGIFSFYCPTSLVCFPIGSCWNMCLGYAELPANSQE
jgi:hypothetical protein